jgi:DNA-binding transcriptional regulator YhcF (GntR family)
LNDGHGYEELEDDFFIQLMNKEGAQVKIKKPTEKKDATKKDSKKDAKKII